jgi:hypothetical protein
LVNSTDFGSKVMGNAQAYRRRAKECSVLASSCVTQEHRNVWLELEQHWLRLAQELELFDRVDPFAAFAMTSANRSSAH